MNRARKNRLHWGILILIALFSFAGCGSGDTAGQGATTTTEPEVVALQPVDTEVSLSSKQLGQVAIAEMRTARATSGVYLLAPFVQAGAQSGPAGPFNVSVEPQGGGSNLLRVTDAQGGQRGVLVVQAPVTANGLTTVDATLGNGQDNFFGCTVTVVYTFDAQGLLQLRFRNLVAAGDFNPDLLPPAVGGFLVRDGQGRLVGRLSVPGNDPNFQPRGFLEDVGGWFQDNVLTPVGNFFGWGQGNESSDSCTIDENFDAVGETTYTSPSLDETTTGFNTTPAGVATVSGTINLPSNNFGLTAANSGARVIGQNGAGVIGPNGASVIGPNGASVVGPNGASVVQTGAGVVGPNGASVVGQNGASATGQTGNALISDNGAALISDNGAALISDNGAALIRGYSLLQVEDVDNTPPSSAFEHPFPPPPAVQLRLMCSLSPLLFADTLGVSTGTNIVYSVRAVDPNGNAVPYSTNLAVWSAVSESGQPVLFQDPNNPGRFVAVNPGNSRVFFNDLENDLVAGGNVVVSGDPVTIPGLIEFARQPTTTQSTFQPLDPSPIVRVTNTDGSSAVGVPVVLEAVGPSAGFVSQVVQTDGSGRARFPDFLLGITGQHQLIARSGNLVVIGQPFQVQAGRTLESIALQADGPTSLQVRETVQLSAIGTLNDGTQVDVSNLVDWTASNANASVSSAGFVRGLVAGSTTIEVFQKGGGSSPLSAQIGITVNAAPAGDLNLGRLFVNLGTNAGQTNGVGVFDLFTSGALDAVSGSPFPSGQPTVNSQGRTARLGNFVFTPTQGGIQTFSFNSTSGQLVNQGLRGLPSTSRFLAGNGTNSLFYLTSGGEMAGVQIDPGTGAEVGSDTIFLAPHGVGNTLWDTWSIQPIGSTDQDIVVVAGRSIDSLSPGVQGTQEAVDVQVFRFDRSVNPPVFTFLGFATVNTGIPFDPLARQLPLATDFIFDKLYVATFYENAGGRITRFDLNLANGALTNQLTAYDYVGQSPEWVLAMIHPNLGPLMLVAAVNGPESRLETFRIEPNGTLTQLFSTGPVSAFYRTILDFTAPGTGQKFLAVLSLQGVSIFSVDPQTAEPTLLQSTDITNSASIAK